MAPKPPASLVQVLARRTAGASLRWSWLDTLATLRDRFREDRLGVTAGSLTFTTLVSLVPLLTVMLAVFTAFPMFGHVQDALERYFLQSFVPATIAKPVLKALSEFTANASRLGTASLAVFFASALVMVLTIDHKLNAIWRVERPRPLVHRVLLYWAAMTLGPLVIGISLTVASGSLLGTRGWGGGSPSTVGRLLSAIDAPLMFLGLLATYRYVPNTYVRWRHAAAGAVVAAAGLVLARYGLTWYLRTVPDYALVYGAFATVPILLVWIYLVWVVVLMGAVVAAYAPSFRSGLGRRAPSPGLEFELAVSALKLLRDARADGTKGVSAGDLAVALRIDPVQLAPVLEELIALDWIARLDEDGAQRYVLLCEPQGTAVTPLVDALLLSHSPTAQRLGRAVHWDSVRLAALLD